MSYSRHFFYVTDHFVKTVFEIQIWSLKCTAITMICRNFNQLFIPIQAYKVVTVCRCNQTTSKFLNVFLIYILVQVVCISTIMLLANDLTNLSGEISNSDWFYEWLILSIWEGSRKLKRWVESEYTLHHWPRSPEMSDCSRPFQ